MDEILAAIDGSAASTKVVDAACEMAKGLSSKILLVCVMHLPMERPEGVEAFQRAEGFKDAYANYLQDLGDQVTRKYSEQIASRGVESRVMTPSGNPAWEIVQIAQVENVRLIVVGVKGLHGIGRIRSLGSVARRVVENSTVPVLVVP